jgi:hypothetical protein
VAVPINTDQRRSPGWWLVRLSRQMCDPVRQKRLKLLDSYRTGKPPLPTGTPPAAREAFEAFCRMSRTNFGRLVPESLGARMVLTGWRTAADSDATGDAIANQAWKAAGGPVESADAHDMTLGLSESYVIVGNDIDEETEAPLVTVEDPRQIIGACDPARPRRLLAVVKCFYDDIEEQDRAYLYMPGATASDPARVWVAVHNGKRTGEPGTPLVNPRSWDWDPESGGEEGQALSHNRMPVVWLPNKDGFAEIEPHLDLFDRINHQILQRMVIATMQAFRQRAVRGLPLTSDGKPARPDNSNVIDYSQVFTMDPAALWQLPATAEMWESGQVDLTPILSATKDDIQAVSAVTRTPLHVFDPTSANQSAEGAGLAREGQVFNARDRIARWSPRWSQVMGLIMLAMGQPERAVLAKIQPLWANPELLSLAERADAASKAQDVPWRTRMITIWGYEPTDVDRMAAERADDQLLAAQVAAAQAAAQPAGRPAPQAPTQPPEPAAAGQPQNAGQQPPAAQPPAAVKPAVPAV